MSSSAHSETTTARTATSPCASREVHFSDDEPEYLYIASLDDIGHAEHAATWLSEYELSETMRDIARIVHEYQGRCRLRRLCREPGSLDPVPGSRADSSDATISCSSTSDNQDDDEAFTALHLRGLEHIIDRSVMESRRQAVASVFQAVLNAQKQDEDSPTTSNHIQDLESIIAQASRQHSQESIAQALQLATIDEEYAMAQQRSDLGMVEDRCLDHGDDTSREDMLQRSIDQARQGIAHREAASSQFLRSLMARVVGMQA